MVKILSNPPIKGRGLSGNPAGRFEREDRVPVDDGWDLDDDLPPLRTTVTEERARSVISYNDSPDIPFDRSINPYRGCEHGCAYCYARPSHANVGLSTGLDFETRLFAKTNAPEVLERELRKSSYHPRTLMLGANTDAYQPIERERRLTRRILEVLSAFRHPVAIVTKSALVLRDLDLLAEMAAAGLATVGISVTTLDEDLSRALEPRAPHPAKRLQAIRALTEAGIRTGVLAAPMIPALNDHELERILEAARDAGAERAITSVLRLPRDLGDLFASWLKIHAPDRRDRVLNQLRAHRAGQLNTTDFTTRMHGQGTEAALLEKRFRLACRQFGLADTCAGDFGLDNTRFHPPPQKGDQLSLL